MPRTALRTRLFAPNVAVYTHRLAPVLLLIMAFIPTAIAATDEKSDAQRQALDSQIAPLLAKRCLQCHLGSELKGGLNLASLATAKKGGENGPAIVPSKLDKSLLWERVSQGEMPPETKLTANELATLKKWIESGAKWGTDPIDAFAVSTASRAGYDWWSLKPLAEVARTPSPDHPIDSFVAKTRIKHKLKAAGMANRRTLIRRVYFDLLGLPPSPAAVEHFVNDKAPQAYERLIDGLLKSPHYGERWARHWLDVVRFGESNGFERDLPREHAWHYRNWVIDALNADMPYDDFVRRQIAGDAFHPDDPESLKAIGFLVAGAHDTVLPSNQVMRQTMRQDELEDIVGVIGQTFLGLTVHCARCHDHKFDPIRQNEYYSLVSSLTGIKHGERDLPTKESFQAREKLSKLRPQWAKLIKDHEAILTAARKSVLAKKTKDGQKGPTPPQPLASWSFDSNGNDLAGSLHAKLQKGAKLQGGKLIVNGSNDSYAVSVPLQKDIGPKTLEVRAKVDDLNHRGGGMISLQTKDGTIFDAIVFGEREPKRWMAGSNGFVRTKSFQGPEEKEAHKKFVHFAIVYEADGTIRAYRNGAPYGAPYNGGPLQKYKKGEAELVFGIRHEPPGGNHMFKGAIDRAQLYDRALTQKEIVASAGANSEFVPLKESLAAMSKKDRARYNQLQKQADDLEKQIKQLESVKSGKIYTALSQAPGVTRVLRRGEVTSPESEVVPAGLTAIVNVPKAFGLDKNANSQQRRKKLAEWITHKNNPLFARVIVNRVWHYHFGTGIVETPNDFGFNGGRPSHPELLDWLALQLTKKKWSLKQLHKLILTSKTYKQSGALLDSNMKLDASNRYLWRKRPLRLDAESLRDAMLSIAGELDPTIGGKGYQDVKSYFFKGTQYYDPLGDDSKRRTIYRFNARGGRSPFLDTFDCPDPSATSPRRAVTTTPLQALSLLNNPFVMRISEAFTKRIKAKAGNSIEKQVDLAYRYALARPATASEHKLVAPYVKEHGLAAFCRVLFNSNEFLYIN